MAIKCINTHFQFSSTNEISICLLNSRYRNFLFFVPSPLKEAPRSPFYDSLALWERSRVGRRATVCVLTLEQGSEGGVGGWARLLGLLRSGSGVFGPLLHVLWND